MLKRVELAVGLGEGTNSCTAIADSDPYSASVIGGTGDERERRAPLATGAHQDRSASQPGPQVEDAGVAGPAR